MSGGESGYRLFIQAELAKCSRVLWSCLVASGAVLEYRLPTHIHLVGDPTDEQKEEARKAWPLAKRFASKDWSRMRAGDAVICTADMRPRTNHGGPRVVISADGAADLCGE